MNISRSKGRRHIQRYTRDGNKTDLINSSVFPLSFTYLATGISAILLRRKYRIESGFLGTVVPALTIAFSALLMTQVSLQQIAISLVLLGVGVPVYTFFSPKSELTELKAEFLSTQAILQRSYQQGDTFLVNALQHFDVRLIYRLKHVQRAWDVHERS